MKRPLDPVLLLSDLPVWGRVAQAAMMPLLERAGIQACCLPTALLSSHGAYPGAICVPQTEFLTRAWQHLQTLPLHFAAVSTGFVGDEAQFPLLETILSQQKARGSFLLVDPILGDHGQLYGLFQPSMVPLMRSLIAQADLITPNLTEAALLLGHDPQNLPTATDQLRAWCQALAELGPRQVVITSAAPAHPPRQTGACWYDHANQSFYRQAHPRLGGGFPGTGDAFAALLLTHILRGRSLSTAVRSALRQIQSLLQATVRRGADPKAGLALDQPV